MTNSEIIGDISKTHREEQIKYIYYKIGVCVAAIGFSITQTIDSKLSYQHIPLFLSLSLFLLSIYYGFKFIEHILGILYLNKGLMDPREEDGKRITEKWKLEIHNDITTKELIKRSGDIRYFTRNNYCLLLAILFFIFWYMVRITL